MRKANPKIHRRDYAARLPLAVGDKVNRWTVIAEADPKINQKGHRVRRVLAECECGSRKVMQPNCIRSETSKSCGCLQREVCRAIHTTHGATAGYRTDPLYLTFRAMHARCYNENAPTYPHYGGRGIKICDAWRYDFAAFAAYIGPKPTSLHTIDRINVDGDYEPGNVQWADKKWQARNRRCARILTIRGIDRVLAEVAEATGLNETSIRGRIERGWDMDEVDQPRLPESERARRASNARWAAHRSKTA